MNCNGKSSLLSTVSVALQAGSLDVHAPEFRSLTALSTVVNAPAFVPGATWRSGSLGSANGFDNSASRCSESILKLVSCFFSIYCGAGADPGYAAEVRQGANCLADRLPHAPAATWQL